MFRIVTLSVLTGLVSGCMTGIGNAEPLWTIGVRDGKPDGFALAPGGYERFRDDGYFSVGRSDAARDWPYIHPGPVDSWAGTRRHTFTVDFGVQSAPSTGSGTLNLFIVDTHPSGNPSLLITVNGHQFRRDTASGGGGLGYAGDLSQVRRHTVTLEFPLNLLRSGGNEIAITTETGSWLIYDALELDAPGVVLGLSPTTRVTSARADQVLLRRSGATVQPISVDIRHFGTAAPAKLHVAGQVRPVQLKEGLTHLDLEMAPVKAAREIPLRLELADGSIAWTGSVMLYPVRPWTVYLLAHSHVDIGYTAFQDDVLRKQIANLDTAIALARKTASYPEGARFKWNGEVLWAVDAYWKQATPEKKEALRDAIRRGWVELQGLYGNELTALCRPEELVRLVEPSARIGRETGKPITTAMITDVPGYTWGMVPVLAGAGMKYFSMGPNPSDRIGFTGKGWADKPYYWMGPSGQEKVLCWMTGTSYNWFHGQTLAQKGESAMLDYLRRLEEQAYPYDLVQVRYTIGGDNGPPDETLPDTVKAWNERYASPRLVLATATEMFQALESKYGKQIPTVSGDFTPYWEDGAGSSALETAMNRASADRLSQAETLWAMLKPIESFPAGRVDEAWRNVVLYSEHTWGAHNSVSEPDSEFVKRQWAYKKAFADDADRQSRGLLEDALKISGEPLPDTVDVFNTSSWERTDLVTVDAAISRAGDRVLDADGQPVPSQRLSSGALVFLARNVPALGASRYRITAGTPPAGQARATDTGLNATGIEVAVDPRTGEITRLRSGSGNVATSLNRYLYVRGRDPKEAVTSGPVTITVKENGPLVSALEIRSAAPGAHALVREVRLVDGLDRVQIADTIDKQAVREKEGVHIGFDFDVPDGVVRMETPWAVVRPEADQIPGACKNWFTVQRWVDVSNASSGVTLAPLDTPLIEIGGITAELPWMESIKPSQNIVSYVMNNYWHTNYKADQSGPTTFRYVLRPHTGYDALATARFGIETSRPLLAARAAGKAPAPSLLTVEPSSAIVETLRPADDGKGWVLRLYGASGKQQSVSLNWGSIRPSAVYQSDLTGKRGRKVGGTVEVPAWGMVTLRVDQ